MKIGKKTGAAPSTQALLGIREIREDGLVTDSGYLAVLRIQPVNLSVLPEDGIRAKVAALTTLLSGHEALEWLAVDDQESFEANKAFCRQRLQKETLPAIRRLLEQDRAHLDRIQTALAASRAFYLLFRFRTREAEGQHHLARIEKSIQQGGFAVRRAGAQELKRMLSMYLQRDVSAEQYEDFDGARWTILGE